MKERCDYCGEPIREGEGSRIPEPPDPIAQWRPWPDDAPGAPGQRRAFDVHTKRCLDLMHARLEGESERRGLRGFPRYAPGHHPRDIDEGASVWLEGRVARRKE